jgi:hypothetical protein
MFKNYFNIRKESQFAIDFSPDIDTETIGFRQEQEEEDIRPNLDFVKDIDNGYELSLGEYENKEHESIYYVLASGPGGEKYVNNKTFLDYIDTLKHLNSIPSETNIVNSPDWKKSTTAHKKARMTKKA